MAVLSDKQGGGMSNEASYYKQALEAVLAEAIKLGVGVHDLKGRAMSGIIGNAIYSWIPTLDKTKSTRVLEEAVTLISSYQKGEAK